MRKIFLSVLITGILFFFPTLLKAQISFSFNISSQPVWGPAGYDKVQYYYLPDIETYYNVPQHRFYYYEGGRWINRSSLPTRYRGYDLYGSYKVVLNERQPWRNHYSYREKYSSFKGRHDQQLIRDSKEPKYFVNKGHPEHNNWIQQQRHDNGNHNGRDKRHEGNDNNKRDKSNSGKDNRGNDRKHK